MTAPLRGETARSLFERLRENGDTAARDQLIEMHLPLARNLARRYRHTPQPLDDLEQVASLALVKAVDGFDPLRGTAFVAYAVPSILGELKRHMRDVTWAVRVPRALQERALAVERVERVLSAQLGRAPTAQQLAAEAGITTEEVLDALSARGAHDAVDLDLVEVSAVRPGSGLSTADDFRDAVEARLSLADAMASLGERERMILRLRFSDGLTQTEIGERLGLSQMYVSRLLRAALDHLRAQIG